MDSPSGGLCSNGLWEGVALRDVIARLGRYLLGSFPPSLSAKAAREDGPI